MIAYLYDHLHLGDRTGSLDGLPKPALLAIDPILRYMYMYHCARAGARAKAWSGISWP